MKKYSPSREKQYACISRAEIVPKKTGNKFYLCSCEGDKSPR